MPKGEDFVKCVWDKHLLNCIYDAIFRTAVHWSTRGNLRSYEGWCNENVSLKQNFAFGQVFCDYSMLITLYKIALSLAWHEWFSCKGKELKIYCCGLVLSVEPQIWEFHDVICQTASKHCTKKRAARAARLVFLIQPIRSLICGVVVASFLKLPVFVAKPVATAYMIPIRSQILLFDFILDQLNYNYNSVLELHSHHTVT